jgi:hypothetical protein
MRGYKQLPSESEAEFQIMAYRHHSKYKVKNFSTKNESIESAAIMFKE